MKKQKQYPCFTYGTLRGGLHNYAWCLAGKTYKEVPATTKGIMFSVSGGGFPCLFPSPRMEIKGELMYIHSDIYEDVMSDLDDLEGYYGEYHPHNMYNRELVTVTDENGKKVEAWVYYWNSFGGTAELVESGCWVTHIAEKYHKKNNKPNDILLAWESAE